jgi:hypothetical protein
MNCYAVCIPYIFYAVDITPYKIACSIDGILTPGNRYQIISMKSGSLPEMNFGVFVSLNPQISKVSSLNVSYLRYNSPAITKTDLTARIPKS